MSEKEEFTCIVCGKEKLTLIMINTKSDKHEIFVRRRGICQDCFLHTDIEEYTEEFAKRKLKEEIEHTKNKLEFLNEELNENKIVETNIGYNVCEKEKLLNKLGIEGEK